MSFLALSMMMLYSSSVGCVSMVSGSGGGTMLLVVVSRVVLASVSLITVVVVS